MHDMFKEFGVIVLDSSIFFSQLDNSFFELLQIYIENGGELFRYPAFRVEIDELQKAVDSTLNDILNRNIEMYDSLIITDIEARELKGNCDCESLVRFLVYMKIDVAVATTNKLLIERLVLNNIKVSIIEPIKNNLIIRPEDFSIYKENSDVLALATPVAMPYVPVDEGDQLVCGDGSVITLTTVLKFKNSEGKEIVSEGKEAVIYDCDRVDMVAKIFKRGNLTDAKLNNIRNFIDLQNTLPWLICPTDILFVDKKEDINTQDSRIAVGYIMRKVYDVTDISIEELFLGDIECFEKEEYKQMKPKYVADVCISIVRQIIFLHMNGILFGDFNGGNFALKNDRSTDYTVFFDTDGYGYKKNPIISRAAEFENPRSYDLHNKMELLRSEYDNLYIAIFRWMTLGMLPFCKSSDGYWKYRDWQNETEQRKARWALIPTAMQKLFNRVFGVGEVRTPTELLFTLKKAYRKINIQPTYSEHFTKLLGSDQPKALITEPKITSTTEPMVQNPEILIATPEPEKVIKPHKPKIGIIPPIQASPKKTRWKYVLIGIGVVVIIIFNIWWFALGHPGYAPKTNDTSITNETEVLEDENEAEPD